MQLEEDLFRLGNFNSRVTAIFLYRYEIALQNKAILALPRPKYRLLQKIILLPTAKNTLSTN